MPKKSTALLALLLAALLCTPALGFASAEGGTLAPMDPPVTITVYGPQTGLSFPDGVQNDEVAQQIAKDTGVIIDLDGHPEDTKFNAMLASGDLPDYLVVCDMSNEKGPATLQRMFEGDMLLPLDEYLDQFAPNIKALDSKLLDFNRSLYNYGTDKLYAIQGYIDPPPAQSFDTGIGPLIRWDYYAEMGYPPINSGDDWLNVVKQMLEKYPTNKDGQPRYGFSLFFEWGWEATFGHPGEIVAALEGKSVVVNRGGFLEYDIISHELKSRFTTPDTVSWMGVDFVYKANKMGLLDPDTFTNKWDNVTEKTTADRVLSSVWTWAYGGINAELAPEAKGYALLPMNTKGMVQGTASPLGVPYRLHCIPKVSRNPEAAMRVMNYLFSQEGALLMHGGFEGKQYNVMDGALKIPSSADEARKTNPNWSLETGIGKYGNFMGLGGNYMNAQYNTPVNIWGQLSNFEVTPEPTPFEKLYRDYYKLAPGESIYKNFEVCTFNGTISSLMLPPPEDIKDITDKINDYLGVELPKLVNSKSDEDYEAGKQAIIAELKNRGVEKVEEWWRGNWATAIEQAEKYN